MLLDASQIDDPTPAWETGTVDDEFSPIYLALARPAPLHGPLAPSEVDLMDLTTVALLLGIGVAGSTGGEDAADLAALAEMGRRRQAGEDISWDTL